MESNSEANRINCSKAAAKILRCQYPELPLRYRGEITVKGKGKMHCYWVDEDSNGSGPGINPGQNHVQRLQNSSSQHLDFSLEPLIEQSLEFGASNSSFQLENSKRTPVTEEAALVDSWHDEEVGKSPSFPFPAAKKEQPVDAPGPFAKLMEHGQTWLRLKDEVYDDEISV